MTFVQKDLQTKDFESALAELESTVAAMESGQLPLEQSLAAYQRGAELLQYCRQVLLEAEQKVQMLDEANTLQPHTDTDD